MDKEKESTHIPTIETTHYILRGVIPEDARELFKIMGNKETMKYITPHPVQSEEEMRSLIIRYLTRFKEKIEIPWVVTHKKDGYIIGQFRLHKLDRWHRKAEMGAVIRIDHQRNGVMTEVLEVIIPFVFDTLQLNRLVGDIFAGNEGSRRLLAKFGFREEGVLRQTDFDGEKYHDTVVYSILKEEYEKR